ncbi:MAG TPA: SCO family protein [Candidatus Limnocylindrales bacterium]|nr:SCO family protein [Candidatus Limnocylindrales bacterium]
MLLAWAAVPAVTRAQIDMPVQNIGVRPDILKDVGIDQKLNEKIPLDLSFRDEQGNSVLLSQFFGQKPVIISLAYYNCPMLCTQVLNGLEQGLKNLSMDAGKEFNVLTISIDPSEKPPLASAKHDLYTGMYGHAGAAEGWHFLTGDEPQIRALASALGFRYAYDPETKQFAHASAIMILTPDGRISRYLFGVQFRSRDLRLGLVEASAGKIGTPLDQVLLFCYHYDPITGKYGLLISRVIKAAGLLTVLAIGIMVFFLRRGEHYALPERKA